MKIFYPFEKPMIPDTSITIQNAEWVSKNDCNWSPYGVLVISVFHGLFLFPHKIVYDCEQGECVKRNGSLLRQITTAIVHTAVITNLITFGANDPNSALSALYRIMNFCFTAFAAIVFHFGWRKLDQVVDILNEISNIAEYMGSFGVPVKCRTREKVAIYFWATVSIIFSVLFALVTLGGNAIWNSFLFAYHNDLSNLGEVIYENVTVRSAQYLVGKFTDPSLTPVSSRPVVVMLGLILQIVNLYTCVCWVFTFCGLFLWGALFVKLFQTFVAKVKLVNASRNGVLQDICNFARLSTILDKWNAIYGGMTFMAAICGILNGTVTVGEVILNRYQGTAFENLISLGAMLPLLLVLVTGSRVNHLASEYGTILLKGQYLEQRFPQGMNAGLSHGLAIVFHQMQTNSVGIQGAGFFTISYSFIGTVVSVMATYAVVILQWGAADKHLTDK